MISTSQSSGSSSRSRRRIMEDFERMLRLDPEFNAEGMGFNYAFEGADHSRAFSKGQMIDCQIGSGPSMRFLSDGTSHS